MATWFRGDLHVHSHLSNGADLTPSRVAAEARAAGLDFFAVTEHDLDTDLSLWTPHAAGLLVLPGRETIAESGHRVTVGPSTDHDHDHDADTPPLTIAAHPRAPYPTGRFRQPLRTVDAIEVWNGAWTSTDPWQADNEAALSDWHRALVTDLPTGRWRPAVGNSDAHLTGQLGTPHNVVSATALTPAAVLAALRSGTGWIAESASVHLALTVDPTGTATVAVRGVPAGFITLHTEHGEIHRHPLPGPARCPTGSALFVRAEVRHPDGRMAALSNPVVRTAGTEAAHRATAARRNSAGR